jgi:hypothetical protein
MPLRAFEAVARLRSVTAAADELSATHRAAHQAMRPRITSIRRRPSGATAYDSTSHRTRGRARAQAAMNSAIRSNP